MRAPCFECPARAVGCHASCNQYKQYREKVAEAKENSRTDRSFYRYLLDRKEERLELEHKNRRKK